MSNTTPTTATEAIAQCRASGVADPDAVARKSWPHLFETTPIDDGGPAYPTTLWTPLPDGSQFGTPHPGISLRDYVAVKAMAAFLSQSHQGPKDWTVIGHGWGEDCVNELNRHDSVILSTLSKFSYMVSDAMLAARKSGGAA